MWYGMECVKRFKLTTSINHWTLTLLRQICDIPNH